MTFTPHRRARAADTTDMGKPVSDAPGRTLLV
jgi:hypothetical protein